MAADKTVRNSVAVADPDAPANVIKPNADGSINVNATSTPGTLGQQTMAASAPVVIASNQSNLPTNLAATGGNTLAVDDAAAGTTVPVPVGGIFQTTLPTYTTGDRAQAQFTTNGQQIVALTNSTGSQVASVSASTADGVSASIATLGVKAVGYGYNGTSLDRLKTLQGSVNTGLGILATAVAELDGTRLTRAAVNITTATTTEIVALTASQLVRVYKIMLNVAAAQTIDFRSNGVSLNGAPMSFGANGSLVLDFDGEPWFVGTVSQNFEITTSTTGAVTGVIYYRKEA